MALRNPGNLPKGKGANSIRLQQQAWEMWKGRFRRTSDHRPRRRFFYICRQSLFVAKNVRRTYPLDARYVCERCFGPLEVVYASRADADPAELRRRIQAGPHSLWRYARLPAGGSSAPRGAARGLDAAAPRRPARRAARAARGVDQERRRQPDPFVQGSRRLGRARARARARLRDDRVRIDRQPRQRRRRACRRGRASSPTCSSPPTSRSRRCSRPGSTGRTWSRSAATTTTSTASAPSSRASTSGRS